MKERSGVVATDELSAPRRWRRLRVSGSAVLTLAQDDHGGDAVALWQISVDGRATGAWVEPQDPAFKDREVAKRLLTCIERVH